MRNSSVPVGLIKTIFADGRVAMTLSCISEHRKVISVHSITLVRRKLSFSQEFLKIDAFITRRKIDEVGREISTLRFFFFPKITLIYCNVNKVMTYLCEKSFSLSLSFSFFLSWREKLNKRKRVFFFFYKNLYAKSLPLTKSLFVFSSYLKKIEF